MLVIAPAIARAADSNAANPAPTAAGTPAPARQVAENSGRLWIEVLLPNVAKASWVSDDLAGRFADLMVATLRTQGYEGKVGTLGPEDSVPSRAAVLFIRLTNWTAKDGVGDCTFTTSLRSNAGDRDLGFFTGDNVIVTADGKHRISSDGLQGSAQEAMNDLYGRIEATGLLTTN